MDSKAQKKRLMEMTATLPACDWPLREPIQMRCGEWAILVGYDPDSEDEKLFGFRFDHGKISLETWYSDGAWEHVKSQWDLMQPAELLRQKVKDFFVENDLLGVGKIYGPENISMEISDVLYGENP